MKIIKEKRGIVFEHLPAEIKSVFVSNDTTKFLIECGDKYSLSEEERSELGEATGLVLLGILSMKEFQDQLHEKIDGPEKQINKLVREVQENIFQPIAGSLKKLDPEAILAQADIEAEEEEGEEEEQVKNRRPALDIPVPPPPGGGGDTPSPSYGGTSDPYREPVDD